MASNKKKILRTNRLTCNILYIYCLTEKTNQKKNDEKKVSMAMIWCIDQILVHQKKNEKKSID